MQYFTVHIGDIIKMAQGVETESHVFYFFI